MAGSNPLLEETPPEEPLETDPAVEIASPDPGPQEASEPEAEPEPELPAVAAEPEAPPADFFVIAPETPPALPEEPQSGGEIALEPVPAEPDQAIEAPFGEPIEEEPPALAEAESPYPGLPDGTELTLVPAEPRPPAYSPAPEPVSEPEPEPEDRIAAEPAAAPADVPAAQVPMETAPPVATAAPAASASPRIPDSEVLRKDAFYLQIGVYASREMAERIGSSLGTAYPLMLMPIRSGARMVYRVLVGPFSEDEQGLILYQVRSRGYRDAFVRQGGD